jgi:hypothetical protein
MRLSAPLTLVAVTTSNPSRYSAACNMVRTEALRSDYIAVRARRAMNRPMTGLVANLSLSICAIALK